MGGRARELCVSLIYKNTHLIEEAASLWLHQLTKAPPMDAISMGIRMSSCDIPGDTRLRPEGHRRELAPSSSMGCLHAHPTAPPFSASPCNHSIHSVTLGFTKSGQSSVSSISYSAYSMFLSPLLRPRGPTRKHRCVHFCTVPPLSLSGSSFLGPWWNRVDGNDMGKLWHHWLTWCSCSLLLVQMDWSEIPPDWQVFLLWGVLVIFQDIHKLGIPNAIVSFLIRGNVLVPTAHHPQSSP